MDDFEYLCKKHIYFFFFLQYQLGSDPVKYLLEKAAVLLNETTNTNCGRLAPIFTHNMRLMFQTV